MAATDQSPEDHETLAMQEPSIHGPRTMANEQKRPDVALARRVWITHRQPFMRNMLTRIGFIDETSPKTNMAKTTGWAQCGARLVDHAPFGHWMEAWMRHRFERHADGKLSSPPCATTGWTRLGSSTGR